MTALVNISIDDVSPHEESSTAVLKQCNRILSVFSDAKFTLFVPAAYWRTIGRTATLHPLRIDHFQSFCKELRGLPRESFELCYHGLFHGVPGKSNNDELQHVSYEDALGIIDDMLTVVTNAGLIDAFKPILRPPAWRMSSDAIRAARARNITTLALSPDDYAMATYGGEQSNSRVVYYTCCPPDKPLQLSTKTEIVYHACLWDRSYLSMKQADELMKFLTTHAGAYEFSFIDGLVDGKI